MGSFVYVAHVLCGCGGIIGEKPGGLDMIVMGLRCGGDGGCGGGGDAGLPVPLAAAPLAAAAAPVITEPLILTCGGEVRFDRCAHLFDLLRDLRKCVSPFASSDICFLRD